MAPSLSNIFPVYPIYDVNIATSAIQNMGVIVGGIDSETNFVRDNHIVSEHINSTIPGYSQSNLTLIENLFQMKINQYMGDTTDVILLSDLRNVNKFAKNTTDNEMKRLTHMRTQTTGELEKNKEKYLSIKYDTQYQQFLINMTQGTLFFVIIVAFIMYAFQKDYISFLILSWILVILSVLFIIVIILCIKAMQSRRNNDWNKFYFVNIPSGKS